MNLFTLPQSLQPSAGNCDVTIWVKYSRMGHPKAIYNRSINQINVGALCRHLFKSSYSVLVNFVLVSFFFIFYVRRLGSHQYTHPIFHQNFRYDLFFLNRLSFGKAKKNILLKLDLSILLVLYIEFLWQRQSRPWSLKLLEEIYVTIVREFEHFLSLWKVEASILAARNRQLVGERTTFANHSALYVNQKYVFQNWQVWNAVTSHSVGVQVTSGILANSMYWIDFSLYYIVYCVQYKLPFPKIKLPGTCKLQRVVAHRYMDEIMPIRRKTLYNKSNVSLQMCPSPIDDLKFEAIFNFIGGGGLNLFLLQHSTFTFKW